MFVEQLHKLDLQKNLLSTCQKILTILLANGSVYSIDEITIEKVSEDEVTMKKDYVTISCRENKCTIIEPSIHNKVIYRVPEDSWVLTRKLDDIL